MIAANDGTEPNAGLSANSYVAYDMCAWLHINVAVQAGHRPAQLADIRSLRWSAQVRVLWEKRNNIGHNLGYTLLTYASRPAEAGASGITASMCTARRFLLMPFLAG